MILVPPPAPRQSSGANESCLTHCIEVFWKEKNNRNCFVHWNRLWDPKQLHWSFLGLLMRGLFELSGWLWSQQLVNPVDIWLGSSMLSFHELYPAIGDPLDEHSFPFQQGCETTASRLNCIKTCLLTPCDHVFIFSCLSIWWYCTKQLPQKILRVKTHWNQYLDIIQCYIDDLVVLWGLFLGTVSH